MLALYGLVAAFLDLVAWLGAKNARPENDLLVSVLVIVKDRDDVVERFLRRLCSLGISGTTLRYEVIVIDDYSTDQTWAIVRRLCSSLTMLKAIRMADVSDPREGAGGIGLFMCAGKIALVCRLMRETDDLALLDSFRGMLQRPRRGQPLTLMG